jgi:radical SAM superfamily enzyme YgiQ (UPF0313 family)
MSRWLRISGTLPMNKSKVVLISFNYSNHFSLAHGYLKAYAEKDTFIRDNTSIQIIDFDVEKNDIRQVLYYLSKEHPGIVGFSCYCWSINKILDLSRLLKQLDHDIKIILGGPEAGPAAEKYLLENPAVDVIVRGEGEESFKEVLSSFLGAGPGLALTKGISYRGNNGVVTTEPRPLLTNLDEIPSPYLTGVLKPRDEVTYIETFRGCPYRCAFCYEGKNFPELRFFSDERIKDEIELIMSLKTIRSFHMVDSVFNVKKERLSRLVQLISNANRSGTVLRTVEIMAELVDREVVQLLKKAQVVSVETGPQTVNRETLMTIKRSYEKEKFKRGITLLLEGGIEVLTDLIIGLPGDNLFRFVRSLKAMMQIKPTTIVCSILHVLPGTELYENSGNLGLEFDEKAPHMVVKNSTFPYEEIDKAVIMSVSVGKEYNMRLPGTSS